MFCFKIYKTLFWRAVVLRVDLLRGESLILVPASQTNISSNYIPHVEYRQTNSVLPTFFFVSSNSSALATLRRPFPCFYVHYRLDPDLYIPDRRVSQSSHLGWEHGAIYPPCYAPSLVSTTLRHQTLV